MIGMHNSLYSQNTLIWTSPVATQSPRRSPNCWLNSTRSNPTQIRWLWHNTNYPHSKFLNRKNKLPLPYPIPLRYNYNKPNLFTTGRSKITYCLLLRQPHSTRHPSYPYPNPLKLHRRNSPNNRSRVYFIYAILPSKLKLRTNSQPNNNIYSRAPNTIPTSRSLMTPSKSR